MTAMPDSKIPVPPAPAATPSASGTPRSPGFDIATGDFDLTSAGGEGLMKQLLVFQKFALDQAAIVAITDVRGRIISVNDKFCQISKYSRTELIGQDHRILNSATHPKQFFKDMYAMIARGKVWHGEIRNRAKDGSFYWVDTTIVPIITNPTQGKISGYVAIRHDITELKNIQERLRIAKEAAEAANHAKGEFLANMSHEIRTPMTAIIGYADLLDDQSRRPGERTEFLQTIRRNGEHLLSVINDILDISKIEAGKLQAENISFDPAKIVSDVESSMRVRAMEKGVGFAIEYSGQIPTIIHSDPTRLRQVLLNLVSNAVKFTNQGMIRILVNYDQPHSKLHFAICDTGIGLSTNQQANLFQPFSQADGSTAREFGGTGLGLALCKRLVEALGGSITVQSQPAKGSTFEFTIHNLESAGQNETAQQTHLQTAPGPGEQPIRRLSGRVLLAEDGADNRRLVSIYLQDAGLRVDTAGDGAEAVRMIIDSVNAGKRYDAVLMDMQMPEVDGYTATAELRRRGLKDLPIIAFTAHAMASEKRKCLECGCDDYATKPVNPEALIQTLAKYIKPAGKKDAMSKPATTPAVRKESPAPPPRVASTPPPSDPGGIARIRSQYLDKPAVCRVLGEYVAGLPSQIAEIRDLLARRDLNTLRRLVHQLRGSGGAYGFPDITRLATEAETSIDGKTDITEVSKRVQALLDVVCRVEGYEEPKKAMVA
jgi:PAS domain S-box-containing protein